MMESRVIKFRAWQIEQRHMMSVQNIQFREDKIVIRAGTKAGVYDYFEVNEFDTVLMQFTGLLDRNGVEIYEGDILPARMGIGNRIVEWDNGTCAFELVDALGEDFTEGEHLLDLSGEHDLGYNPWEVLGNIWESPDLVRQDG